MNPEDICLTTLAIGNQCCRLASLLAQDLIDLQIDNPLLILTDQPKYFKDFKNVVPIQHQIQSVGIYHEKRFCLEESLKRFECCIFLDADCRLFKNVVISRPWKKGITAKSCQNLVSHLTRKTSNIKKNERIKNIYEISVKISKQYNIDLENCKFINEIYFIFRKDEIKHKFFLEGWEEIRKIFEYYRIYHGEGITMGLAAYLADLNVYHYDSGYLETPVIQQIDDVYKDKLFPKDKKINLEIKDSYLKFEQERKAILNQNLFIEKINKLIQARKKEQRYRKLQTNFN